MSTTVWIDTILYLLVAVPWLGSCDSRWPQPSWKVQRPSPCVFPRPEAERRETVESQNEVLCLPVPASSACTLASYSLISYIVPVLGGPAELPGSYWTDSRVLMTGQILGSSLHDLSTNVPVKIGPHGSNKIHFLVRII